MTSLSMPMLTVAVGYDRRPVRVYPTSQDETELLHEAKVLAASRGVSLSAIIRACLKRELESDREPV